MSRRAPASARPEPVAPATGGATRAAIDFGALMKIRSLELRAKVVVEGLRRGLHRSPTHGFSAEFSEYRPYSAGDDVRYLDWRLYARSDRDFIKKYEDETNLRCQLIVDQSRSMAFAGGAATAAGAPQATGSKADYAAIFAATWAMFLFGQGDAVGLTTFAAGIDQHVPARNRPGHLRRLLAALERPAAGRQSDLAGALDQITRLVRRRGMLVLISDLLLSPDACARPLAALRAAGHEVLVVQVLDPVERTLAAGATALDHPLRLRDLETDAVMDVDPGQLRAAYRRGFEADIARIAGICRDLGIAHHVLMTDQPLDAALATIIGGRARRGRSSPQSQRDQPSGGSP
jgi:uncharacterized protein (DUF58 family)